MAKEKKVIRSGIDKDKPAIPQLKQRKDATKRTRTEAELIALERNIRVFVKRTGGFRLNLHDESAKQARDLMAQDKGWSKRAKGREGQRTEKAGWDTTIHVPSYDNVDHASNQRKLNKK